MRTILIILTTLAILILPGLVFVIYDSKADEELFMGDSDSHELILSENEQDLIDRVILRYEWDEVVQGTTTVTMKAHVN